MGDLISRQAAIDALKEHRALFCDNTPDTFSKLSYGEKCRVDELDTAISTLVNLPSAQPTQTDTSNTLKALDCVERQAAIDALDCINGTEEVLRSLPSAQPEVVRCKDCKYGDTFHKFDEPDMPMKCLGQHYGGTYPDDFCSYAERREE